MEIGGYPLVPRAGGRRGAARSPTSPPRWPRAPEVTRPTLKSGEQKQLYALALGGGAAPDHLLKAYAYRHPSRLSSRPSSLEVPPGAHPLSRRRRTRPSGSHAAGRRRAPADGEARDVLPAGPDRPRRDRSAPALVRREALTRLGGAALPAALGAFSRRVHDAGLFQDDFAPNNFLVQQDGEPEFLLVDFERARLVRRLRTRDAPLDAGQALASHGRRHRRRTDALPERLHRRGSPRGAAVVARHRAVRRPASRGAITGGCGATASRRGATSPASRRRAITGIHATPNGPRPSSFSPGGRRSTPVPRVRRSETFLVRRVWRARAATRSRDLGAREHALVQRAAHPRAGGLAAGGGGRRAGACTRGGNAAAARERGGRRPGRRRGAAETPRRDGDALARAFSRRHRDRPGGTMAATGAAAAPRSRGLRRTADAARRAPSDWEKSSAPSPLPRRPRLDAALQSKNLEGVRTHSDAHQRAEGNPARDMRAVDVDPSLADMTLDLEHVLLPENPLQQAVPPSLLTVRFTHDVLELPRRDGQPATSG